MNKVNGKNPMHNAILQPYEYFIPKEVWEACKPVITENSGRIIMFGTGGDMKYSKELEKAFYNPEK